MLIGTQLPEKHKQNSNVSSYKAIRWEVGSLYTNFPTKGFARDVDVLLVFFK
jgi:hypothetical protein